MQVIASIVEPTIAKRILGHVALTRGAAAGAVRVTRALG